MSCRIFIKLPKYEIKSVRSRNACDLLNCAKFAGHRKIIYSRFSDDIVRSYSEQSHRIMFNGLHFCWPAGAVFVFDIARQTKTA